MEGLIDGTVSVGGGSTLLELDEPSQIGAARRSAVSLGSAHGLDAEAVGRLAIVVTEAATNIVRHAHRGMIVLRGLIAGATPAIEMLALDKGPGIPEVPRAMRDGYSTSGTAGVGLGAMQRLSQVFEVHSQRKMGTAVLARIGHAPHSDRTRSAQSPDDRIGAVCVALRGESECGDAWQIRIIRRQMVVLLVDGLGHGPDAATAAARAMATFSHWTGDSPDGALPVLGSALRGTRGAALSLAVVDEQGGTLRFAGVGNVDGRVFNGEAAEYLVPQNGIIGHTMPALRVIGLDWPAGARLVMHSDGINSRWRMIAYPGLSRAHPALVAGVIYRDFASARDDATILVLDRQPPEEQA
jgi:anti-sigma regulatory factor (Ser/Thr protein kinase)